MIDFSATTAFRLVRQLAVAGRDAPSIYLLVCETAAMGAVRTDLEAEVQVQLGVDLRSLSSAEVQPERLGDVFSHGTAWPVILITLDRWLPKLADSFDRNIVLLARSGTVLFVAGRDIAERVLAAAPNLRNRLTDILLITPDETFGDPPA